jgi:peptidoglycan-N-acetylglucosamine deacetylase
MRVRSTRSVPRGGLATFSVALALAMMYGAYRWTNARTFQAFGAIIARVDTNEPLVALSFDDGPDRNTVGRLLPMLATHHARATFFVEGRVLEHEPALGRELWSAGHELGNHTYSHERMVLKSQRFIASEIERTDAAIRAAGQLGTIHFRPPFGKKLLGLPWYLAQRQRTTIMWDVEPDSDASIARSPAQIAEHVATRARPGSIILLHVMQPNRLASLQAVPTILSNLSARGYRFVSVSELLRARSSGT